MKKSINIICTYFELEVFKHTEKAHAGLLFII
jgi:hypothetical protein